MTAGALILAVLVASTDAGGERADGEAALSVDGGVSDVTPPGGGDAFRAGTDPDVRGDVGAASGALLDPASFQQVQIPWDGGVPQTGRSPASDGAERRSRDLSAPPSEDDSAPEAIMARPFGTLTAGGAVDLWWHPAPPLGPAEQIAEARSSARIGVDLSLRRGVRLLIEGRFRWAAATQAGLRRAEATFEPTLGEAFLDVYLPQLDLRIGQQILTLGAQPSGAPQDVLAPRELRDDPLLLPSAEAKLPVFAARATGELAQVRWTALYVPFFAPDRYAVFGDDQALLQPAAGGALPLPVDPSIEDRLQERLLETSRPVDTGIFGDLSLAARYPLGPVTVGASWTWFSEKLPQVTLDPELETALDATRRDRPIPPAVLLSLQNRFAAGETLLTGEHRRQHLFALDASALVGSVQLDADVAFTPRRSFVDARLRPLNLPSLSWGITAAPAEETKVLYAVSYQGLAAMGVPAERLLFLLESPLARGADRTAFLHLVSAAASYALLDGEWTVAVRAAVELVQRSYAVSPEVSWRPREGLRVHAAVSLLGGPARSPFGYFGRNDAAAVGVEMALF